MSTINRIGLLTSGGDAPGMNAAIRAVVRTALSQGVLVSGIERGYQGLIQGAVIELTSRSVADTIQRGGTILRTARSDEFRTPEGQAKAIATLKRYGIDGLVLLGGDGTFRGAYDLTQAGIATVSIPCTIDNDIACTDQSLGFDTAVNTVVEAMNKIRDTATSHERTYVIEVMGRHSGYIALHAGLCGGAESILIPEVPIDLDAVCDRVTFGYRVGKNHSIVLVAEGIGNDSKYNRNPGESAATYVANYIQTHTGLETRITILGHLQRGGNPTALDRQIATRLGNEAVNLLLRGEAGKVVAMWQNEMRVYDIMDALAMKKAVDLQLYELSQMLSSV